jgi:Protein of unknown function (DUF1566)
VNNLSEMNGRPWGRGSAWSAILSLGLVVGVAVAGCGDTTSGGGADAGGDAGGDAVVSGDASTMLPDGGTTGVSLTVTALAVETCGVWEPMHQPELSYQTPSNIKLGVLAVELMRSHKDPEPVTLALASPLVEIDASAGGTVLSVDTGAIPAGTYSYIRLKLAHTTYELQATAHGVMTAPGTLEIDMALSNHVDPEGQVRAQGQYVATFSAFGQEYSFAGNTPFNCTLSEWGGIAFTAGTDFVVRVPLPGGPLVVDHGAATPLVLDLQFPMRDAFAWRDLPDTGFADGVLDISQPPGPVELPDALVECHLLMADRCQGEAVNPIHPTWPMPDSSIDFCSDGAQIAPCPASGEPGYGQDAQYTVNAMDYDIGVEVVTDQVTGLEWQRAVPPDSYDWWEARDYCAELTVDGQTDWRLPSRMELVSLLDFGSLDPTIDLDAFPGTPSDFFWTASPVPFLNLAYGVRFELGFIYDHDPHGSGRVRCVRAAYSAPQPRFTYDADTVTDLGTGLVWQRTHLAALTWLNGLDACESLDLAGQTDWRLPTLKELQTLVDDRRLQPSIDVVAFPNTPSEWFWSSTPIQFPPNEAWATSYTDGYASIHAFDELQLVRCVRDE